MSCDSSSLEPMKIIRWDTYDQVMKVKDKNGDPVNIAGYTIYFTVKKKSGINTDDDVDNEIQKILTVHSNPTQWETQLRIESSETEDLAPWEYRFDVQIVSPGGDVSSAPKRPFIVLQDVTKDT